MKYYLTRIDFTGNFAYWARRGNDGYWANALDNAHLYDDEKEAIKVLLNLTRTFPEYTITLQQQVGEVSSLYADYDRAMRGI